MLPLLQLAGDGNEHTLSEAADVLANHFGLGEDERREPLPSSRQGKFYHRLTWARNYLGKAKLLTGSGRGRFQITERGHEVLSTDIHYIDSNYLRRFPEFRAFRRMSETKPDIAAIEDKEGKAPDEILDEIIGTMRRQLAQDLLEQLKASTPRRFEQIVIDVLLALGYGGSREDAGLAVGQSGDGGIDGIIKEDRLGLDTIYVQAKRWEGNVGRPIVQGFAGSLDGVRARKGVLITTSQFTPEAKDFVGRIEKRIILIDREQLAQFMIDFNVGVEVADTYVIKKIDEAYFNEG